MSGLRAGSAFAPALAVAVVIGAAGASPPVAAQERGLALVDRLVRTGRTEEARVELLDWWEEGWGDATRDDAQRALWLRARLTVDPREAELDYRRLVIEYPGGSFSDEALLRLAQAAHALGDGEDARRHVDALARDYPESAAVREGRRWLAAAGEPLSRMDPDEVTGPPEPRRSGEIVGVEPPQPRDPAAAVVPHGRFAVQLGAFASAGRASSLRNRVTELGVEARLVRMPRTRLIHVRAGRFDSEAAARDLLAAIERLGFTGAVVRDADSEEAIGG